MQVHPRPLTPDQVAEYLNVTPKYVRNLARRGHIGHSRVGYRYWFTEDDVQDFLRNTRVSA